eukprot:Platyproteum_vivax@DN7521_c0_g1_i1.p1
MTFFLLVLALAFAVSSAKITGGTVSRNCNKANCLALYTFSLDIDEDIPAGTTTFFSLDRGQNQFELDTCPHSDFTSGDVSGCTVLDGKKGATITFRAVKAPTPIKFSVLVGNKPHASYFETYFTFKGVPAVTGEFQWGKIENKGVIEKVGDVAIIPPFIRTWGVHYFPFRAQDELLEGDWIHIRASNGNGVYYDKCAEEGQGFAECVSSFDGAKFRVAATIPAYTYHVIVTTFKTGGSYGQTNWMMTTSRDGQELQQTYGLMKGPKLRRADNKTINHRAVIERYGDVVGLPAFSGLPGVYVFPFRASDPIAAGDWIHITQKAYIGSWYGDMCAQAGSGFESCEEIIGQGARFKLAEPIPANTLHKIATTFRPGHSQLQTKFKIEAYRDGKQTQSSHGLMPGPWLKMKAWKLKMPTPAPPVTPAPTQAPTQKPTQAPTEPPSCEQTHATNPTYLELATYNTTAGATQTIKVGFQIEKFAGSDPQAFTFSIPHAWSYVKCEANWSGQPLVQNGVIYRGLPGASVSAECFDDGEWAKEIVMTLNRGFPETSSTEGLYFQLTVVMPPYDNSRISRPTHTMQMGTMKLDNAPCGLVNNFIAMKTQSSNYKEVGTRVWESTTGQTVTQPPNVSNAVVSGSGERLQVAFTLKLRDLVRKHAGAVTLVLYGAKFAVTGYPNVEQHPDTVFPIPKADLYDCQPGDKLRPDWVTDEMDVVKQGAVMRVETFHMAAEMRVYAIELPYSVQDRPEEIFLVLNLQGYKYPYSSDFEYRIMKFGYKDTLSVIQQKKEEVAHRGIIGMEFTTENTIYFNWPFLREAEEERRLTKVGFLGRKI